MPLPYTDPAIEEFSGPLPSRGLHIHYKFSALRRPGKPALFMPVLPALSRRSQIRSVKPATT
jgi:hypothetical protein